VGPRARLEGCGKFAPTGIRFPHLPVRSESPYRLSYPGLLESCGEEKQYLSTGICTALTWLVLRSSETGLRNKPNSYAAIDFKLCSEFFLWSSHQILKQGRLDGTVVLCNAIMT
jgi:hypothetical protein